MYRKNNFTADSARIKNKQAVERAQKEITELQKKYTPDSDEYKQLTHLFKTVSELNREEYVKSFVSGILIES